MMQIPLAKLTPVADAVRQLKEALRLYCLAPDKIPVSMEDLQYALEQLYDVKVRTIMVRTDSKFIIGLIEFYDDKIEIYIKEGDRATTRLVFAKEVGQIILRDAENVTEDPVKLIRGIISVERLPFNPQVAPDVLSESLALIVAIELLFPYELRADVRKRIETGEASLSDEADRLDVPEFLVETAISDDYMKLSTIFWNLDIAAE